MLSVAKRWAGPAVIFLVGLGFHVSGIENIFIAIGLWSVAAVWGLVALVTWLPICATLACLKVEVQGYNFLGQYPLPPPSIFGEMKLLEVKVRFRSRFNMQLHAVELHIGKSTFGSEEKTIRNVGHNKAQSIHFEIPIQWFKGKSKNAYLRVSVRGREWYSNEFTITAPSVGLGEGISLPNLKQVCQQLSQDMLQFLIDRQRLKPDLTPTRKQWRKQSSDHTRHIQETVALYHQRFGARVVSLYEHLKERGYHDKQADRLYEHPTNELGIRELAQRLGALVERLP